MKQFTVKTGQKTPESGIYRAKGSYIEIALSKDDRVPPNNFGKTPKFVFMHGTKGGR